MSFNALLENINRKNRSYGQVGNQSPAARIQRMNPLLDTMSAVPIGPNVVSQVNVPGAQNIGAPQARGVPLLPFAQNMPAPAAQPMPVGEDVAPPNVIPLNTPATEEIEPTNIQLDDPEEVVSEDDTFFNQISRAASQGVEGVQQWASGVAQDDEKMGKLILALNSMRRKPDAGIAAAAREQIKGAQAERTSNRTIEYLKSQGASSTFMEIAKTDPNKALIEFEKSKKPVDRKTLEDAAGYKRYADTGERVFPGVEKGKDRKIIEDVAGRQRYADTGELTFPDIDVPAKQEAPATEAARTRLDQLIGKYGQEQGSAMFEREQQSHAIERARATVPPPPAAGNLGIEDLQSARTQVRTEFKQFDQPLEMIDQASVLANLAGAGTGEENSQAEAQLDKALAQVSGDRQTSMLEVNRLANTGNLAVRAGNVISKWLTGTQTEFTLNEKKQLLGELKEFHEARRKDHEGFLKDLYKQSNWPDDMVDKLFNQRQEFVGGSGWSTTSSGTKFKVVQ